MNSIKINNKIGGIVARLQQQKRKVTTNNIMLESLFLSGGTLTEEQIKIYLKNPESPIEWNQRKNRLIYFYLSRFTDKQLFKMTKEIKKSDQSLTAKISKSSYLIQSIDNGELALKAEKLKFK